MKVSDKADVNGYNYHFYYYMFLLLLYCNTFLHLKCYKNEKNYQRLNLNLIFLLLNSISLKALEAEPGKVVDQCCICLSST